MSLANLFQHKNISKSDIPDFFRNKNLKEITKELLLDGFKMITFNIDNFYDEEADPDGETFGRGINLLEFLIESNNFDLASEIIDLGFPYEPYIILKSNNKEFIQKYYNDDTLDIFKIAEFGQTILLDMITGIESKINLKNDKSQTPLIVSLIWCNFEFANKLLELGADAFGPEPLERYFKISNKPNPTYKLSLEFIQKLVYKGSIVNSQVLLNSIEKIYYYYQNKFSYDLNILYNKEAYDIFEYLFSKLIDTPNKQIIDKFLEYINLSSINTPSEYKLKILKLWIESLAKWDINFLTLIFNQVITEMKNFTMTWQEINKTYIDSFDIYKTILDYIINLGWNINIKDSQGNTPIYYCRHPRTLKYLIELGAEITVTNKLGQTPFDYICKNNLKHLSKQEEFELLQILNPNIKLNELNIKVYNLSQEELARILEQNGYHVEIN
jgi:ankyrin repeat protein